jgi:hypothetical protein
LRYPYKLQCHAASLEDTRVAGLSKKIEKAPIREGSGRIKDYTYGFRLYSSVTAQHFQFKTRKHFVATDDGYSIRCAWAIRLHYPASQASCGALLNLTFDIN